MCIICIYIYIYICIYTYIQIYRSRRQKNLNDPLERRGLRAPIRLS